MNSVAKSTGFDPNARLNMNDPAVQKSLIKAITRVEVGGNRVSDAQIERGLALRQPPPAPAGAPVQLSQDAGTARAPGGAGSALDGSLQVGVTVRGAPGTQARATQTGDGMEPLQLRQAPVGAM